MRESLQIENAVIGDNNPTFIIAEVGQAHDGSLGQAHSFIDAAAERGVDAIKFQTHFASEESTVDEKFRIQFSYADKTRYDYWKRMEFSQTEWEGLYLHAKERNIIFLSSVFSIKSIDLLSKIGVSAWKVGSGEVNNKILLDKLIQTQKPILLSTGMSNWDEINQVVNFLEEDDASYGLFQCTSKYPTTYEEIGLNVISEFRKKFNVPIGFSDHSGNIFPALYAMALGVNLVELHVTFHKQIFGPDTASSVTFEELKTVVDARDAFHKMKVSSVNKDTMESGLLEMKELFGRSVCLINDLPKGTVLEAAMLTTKKPSTGIRHDQLKECIGRKLKKGVSANRVLLWEDLEQNPD